MLPILARNPIPRRVVARNIVVVRRELLNRQRVNVITGNLAIHPHTIAHIRSTDQTYHAALRVREVELGGAGDGGEVVADNRVQGAVLGLQEGAAVANQPAQVIHADHGGLGVADGGAFHGGPVAGAAEDRGHRSSV
jgi:hypothetical protein